MQLYLNKVQRRKTGKGKGSMHNKGPKAIEQSKTNYRSIVDRGYAGLEKLAKQLSQETGVPVQYRGPVSAVSGEKVVAKQWRQREADEKRQQALAERAKLFKEAEELGIKIGVPIKTRDLIDLIKERKREIIEEAEEMGLVEPGQTDHDVRALLTMVNTRKEEIAAQGQGNIRKQKEYRAHLINIAKQVGIEYDPDNMTLEGLRLQLIGYYTVNKRKVPGILKTPTANGSAAQAVVEELAKKAKENEVPVKDEDPVIE